MANDSKAPSPAPQTARKFECSTLRTQRYSQGSSHSTLRFLAGSKLPLPTPMAVKNHAGRLPRRGQHASGPSVAYAERRNSPGFHKPFDPAGTDGVFVG